MEGFNGPNETADPWSPIKGIFKDLYLNQRKSLDEVIEIIAATHGFKRSKSLYEAKRREWGFSKKSKAGDWADVGRITKIRRYCHGKESEVYRSGELISTKKLKKEISRHLLPTLQKQNSSTTRPPTPTGFYICTPPRMSSDDYLLHNTPWLQFLSAIGINSSFSLNLGSLAHSFTTGRFNPGFPDRNQLDGNLDGLTALFGHVSSYSGTSYAHQDFMASTTTRIMHDKLRAMIPDDLNVAESIQIRNVDADPLFGMATPYIGVLVYFLSNSILSKRGEEYFVDILTEKTNRKLLMSLLNIKTPSTTCLANRSLERAVLSQDCTLVEMILRIGVCPSLGAKRVPGSYIPIDDPHGMGNIRPSKVILDRGLEHGIDACALKGHLQTAIFSGHLEVAKLLIQYGTGPTKFEGDYDYWNDMIAGALYSKNKDLLRLLLKVCNMHGYCQTQTRYNLDRFPLCAMEPQDEPITGDIGCPWDCAFTIAVKRRDFDTFRVLLEYGFDPDIQNSNKDRNTILEQLVKQENIVLVEYLLEHGVQYNNDILQIVCGSGNVGLATLFLAYGANVNAQIKYQVQDGRRVSTVDGANGAADSDIDEAADFDEYEYGPTALQIACKTGTMDLVKLLINHGANINAVPPREGPTALEASIHNDDIAITRFLLQHGAYLKALRGPSKKSLKKRPPTRSSALKIAVEKGSTDLVSLLLQYMDHRNRNMVLDLRVALFAACDQDRIGLARLFLAHGARVNFAILTLAGYTTTRKLPTVRRRRMVKSTPLIRAIQNQNIPLIQLLLQWGADANYGQPLKSAIYAKNLESIRILLDNGANESVNTINAAIKSNDDEIIHLLFAHNFNSTLLNTALPKAVEEGHFEIAQYWLEQGANANGVNSGRSPLLGIAVMNGDIKIARLLLHHGADSNIEIIIRAQEHPRGRRGYDTALGVAIDQCNLDLMHLLLEHGANPNLLPTGNRCTQISSPVCKAIFSKREDILRLVIQYGGNLSKEAASSSYAAPSDSPFVDSYLANFQRDVPLQVAIDKKEFDVFHMLLDYGADPNIFADLRMSSLSYSQKEHIVKLLLENGADIDAISDVPQEPYSTGNGYTPREMYSTTALSIAASEGDVKLVELLVKSGAAVNHKESWMGGCIALQAASKKGDIPTVRWLIEHGADVNIWAENAPKQRQFGSRSLCADPFMYVQYRKTALQLAVTNGNVELVELLLLAGADPNLGPGITALHIAASRGGLVLVKRLLEYGADVNASRAERGRPAKTALIYAAEYGRLDIVQVLLNAGMKHTGSGEIHSMEALAAAQKPGHWRHRTIFMTAGKGKSEAIGWRKSKHQVRL